MQVDKLVAPLFIDRLRGEYSLVRTHIQNGRRQNIYDLIRSRDLLYMKSFTW